MLGLLDVLWSDLIQRCLRHGVHGAGARAVLSKQQKNAKHQHDEASATRTAVGPTTQGPTEAQNTGGDIFDNCIIKTRGGGPSMPTVCGNLSAPPASAFS